MFDADQDTAPKIKTETREQGDDPLYCARCGHLVTRGRWAFAPAVGEVFTNPAGHTFHLRCFTEAPGATDAGAPTDDFTWFPGYEWNFALCRGCSEHLGWRYMGEAAPPVFWGLIKDRLSSQPK